MPVAAAALAVATEQANGTGGSPPLAEMADETQAELRSSGKDKVIGSYKLCVSVDGEVATVSQLKSTGFAAYDGKIIDEIKRWRYLPYIYDGAPVPVCTAVTVIYAVPG